MATKIVTKNSSTASAVPTASDLVQGELAVNVADKRLFTEDNGGSIVELGTNPSTIDINAGTIDGTAIGASSASTGAFTTLTASGEITANGGIALGDNDKAKFGAGNDLQIYHDGSNSYISDQGTNDLKILATDFQLKNAADNEFMMTAVTDGAVTLYHNSAAKLATTSTGIDVTGTVTASPSGGVATLGANGHITSKQSLDVATAGGRYIGSSNRGILGQLRIEQATTGADGGYIDFDTCANGSTSPTTRMRIDSSGNVGMGTSAIMQDFGSGRTTLALKGTGTADYSTLQLGNYGTSSNDQIHGLINFYDGTTSVSRIQSVRASNTSDANLAFYTAPSSGGITERMRIDSSGNVGIGITSSLEKFTVANASSGIVGRFTNNTNQTLDLGVISGSGAAGGVYYNSANSGYHAFQVGGTERMRIDSSGNLLVGKTSTAIGTAGHTFGNDGYVYHTRAGDIMFLNRTGSDGTHMHFYKDGAGIGAIGVSGGNNLYISSMQTNHAGLTFATDAILPTRQGSITDNITDLGSSTERFDDIYATNGTIQTSDRNEKQDIAELSEAEQRVAVAAKGLLRKFRWKDSVAEKGDDARIHFGIIAQDLQAAFEAEGLDAGDYAMFISTTWTDEETNEEKTRMGVRYSELLAFIISAI